MADCLISARAIGTGKGLSKESFAAMLAPTTAGIGFWTEQLYFGLGVVSNNGWIMQTPSFHGYGGLMAYLPAEDLSIVIYSTKKEAAEIGPNESTEFFKRLTTLLTPEDPAK